MRNIFVQDRWPYKGDTYMLYSTIETLLSGTMIRGTLIRGPKPPEKHKHMLGNRAHEGLQSPSNPEERKGLKESQHAAHVRSASAPPSDPRGDLRLARGLLAEALDRTPRLRLARG